MTPVKMYSVAIRNHDGSQTGCGGRWFEFESARMSAVGYLRWQGATAVVVYFGSEPVYVCYPEPN